MMKPLILITNDDGVQAKGIAELAKVAREFGDVVVMAPERNASGKAHSLTTGMPLRATEVRRDGNLGVYCCNGTPVDCVKLAVEHFCDRPADLVLSGINHGSNASVNVMYSGTMGAVIEASNNGYPAVGFSLLEHRADADFDGCMPWIRKIIEDVLTNGLPEKVSLNVNFPTQGMAPYKGMKVCRGSKAKWADSFEKRIDPYGGAYYWLTGNFQCTDKGPDTDQWALENGYASIVPITSDFTHHPSINTLAKRLDQ